MTTSPLWLFVTLVYGMFSGCSSLKEATGIDSSGTGECKTSDKKQFIDREHKAAKGASDLSTWLKTMYAGVNCKENPGWGLGELGDCGATLRYRSASGFTYKRLHFSKEGKLAYAHIGTDYPAYCDHTSHVISYSKSIEDRSCDVVYFDRCASPFENISGPAQAGDFNEVIHHIKVAISDISGDTCVMPHPFHVVGEVRGVEPTWDPYNNLFSASSCPSDAVLEVNACSTNNKDQACIERAECDITFAMLSSATERVEIAVTRNYEVSFVSVSSKDKQYCEEKASIVQFGNRPSMTEPGLECVRRRYHFCSGVKGGTAVVLSRSIADLDERFQRLDVSSDEE